LRQLRSDPASIGIAVASSGGANHIAVGLVAKKAGIDVRKLKVVVFNSGGDTLTALLGGHVQLVAANPASAASLVQSGKLRAIAVAAPKRLDGLYANVPTWREQGVDAVLMTWRGVVGPRDMGAGEIAYWEGVFRQMAQTKDWQDDLRKNFWVDNYLDSAGAKAFLQEEYGQLKAVLSDLGLAK
jgi:putative tricarboxylic transport membrane protein